MQDVGHRGWQSKTLPIVPIPQTRVCRWDEEPKNNVCWNSVGSCHTMISIWHSACYSVNGRNAKTHTSSFQTSGSIDTHTEEDMKKKKIAFPIPHFSRGQHDETWNVYQTSRPPTTLARLPLSPEKQSTIGYSFSLSSPKVRYHLISGSCAVGWETFTVAVLSLLSEHSTPRVSGLIWGGGVFFISCETTLSQCFDGNGMFLVSYEACSLVEILGQSGTQSKTIL